MKTVGMGKMEGGMNKRVIMIKIIVKTVIIMITVLDDDSHVLSSATHQSPIHNSICYLYNDITISLYHYKNNDYRYIASGNNSSEVQNRVANPASVAIIPTPPLTNRCVTPQMEKNPSNLNNPSNEITPQL